MTMNMRWQRGCGLDRRSVLVGGLAVPFAGSRVAMGESTGQIPLGDMHAHLFFVGPNPAHTQPLGRSMAAGGATLVNWSLVGDMPWIGRSPGGLKQKATPGVGAATEWFRSELDRVKKHIAEQGLKIAATGKDIDAALSGVPHVVLGVEGASFLDDDIANLKMARDAGIRHIQLVHYIGNSLGDFQTEAPRHQGLTEKGRKVIAECNRLGILVDLAHCSEETVRHALEVARAPVVWSHSSVANTGAVRKAMFDRVAWKARQLSLDAAKAIAAKGGVIGLWGLRSDVGGTVESYAARLVEMARWLGPRHVAFGSDINALTGSPIGNYADLRRAMASLERSGLPTEHLRDIAIGNYARVLKQAMEAGQA